MINAYLTNVKLDDRTLLCQPVGSHVVVEEIVFNTRAVFWMNSNRQAMKGKLQAGTHLVVDRYAYSGVAVSIAKVTNPCPIPSVHPFPTSTPPHLPDMHSSLFYRVSI
jgi:hypothetical protein